MALPLARMKHLRHRHAARRFSLVLRADTTFVSMATGEGAAYEDVPTAPGRALWMRWRMVCAPQVGAPSSRRSLL